MPLAVTSRSAGILKPLPVRVSGQRLRRILRMTSWFLMGKSVTLTASIKPLDSECTSGESSSFILSSRLSLTSLGTCSIPTTAKSSSVRDGDTTWANSLKLSFPIQQKSRLLLIQANSSHQISTDPSGGYSCGMQRTSSIATSYSSVGISGMSWKGKHIPSLWTWLNPGCDSRRS